MLTIFISYRDVNQHGAAIVRQNLVKFEERHVPHQIVDVLLSVVSRQVNHVGFHSLQIDVIMQFANEMHTHEHGLVYLPCLCTSPFLEKA